MGVHLYFVTDFVSHGICVCFVCSFLHPPKISLFYNLRVEFYGNFFFFEVSKFFFHELHNALILATNRI